MLSIISLRNDTLSDGSFEMGHGLGELLTMYGVRTDSKTNEEFLNWRLIEEHFISNEFTRFSQIEFHTFLKAYRFSNLDNYVTDYERREYRLSYNCSAEEYMQLFREFGNQVKYPNIKVFRRVRKMLGFNVSLEMRARRKIGFDPTSFRLIHNLLNIS